MNRFTLIAGYTLPYLICIGLGVALGRYAMLIGSSALILYYLHWQATYRKHLTLFAVLAAMLPLMELLALTPRDLATELVFMWFTWLIAGAMVVVYLLRWWSKPNRAEALEFVKLPAALLVAWGFSFPLAQGFGILTLACAGYIYLVTRMTQSPKLTPMFKNVLIAALMLILVFAMVFSFIKSTEAEKHATSAQELHFRLQEAEQETTQQLATMNARIDSLSAALAACAEK